MFLLNLFLIALFSIAFLAIGLSDKLRTYKRLLIIALYLTVVLLIIAPSVADYAASLVSVEYGSDLAVYVAIAFLVMSFSVVYARGERQIKITTKLIRELAMKDVKKT